LALKISSFCQGAKSESATLVNLSGSAHGDTDIFLSPSSKGGGWESWIRRHLVIEAPCDPSSTLLVSIVAPTSGHTPLNTPFHLFLPCPGHKWFEKGGKMMVLPSLSSTQLHSQHLHRSRQRRLNKKNRLQQSPVRKAFYRGLELLQVQYRTH
jgi:hypothetical protein